MYAIAKTAAIHYNILTNLRTDVSYTVSKWVRTLFGTITALAYNFLWYVSTCVHALYGNASLLSKACKTLARFRPRELVSGVKPALSFVREFLGGVMSPDKMEHHIRSIATAIVCAAMGLTFILANSGSNRILAAGNTEIGASGGLQAGAVMQSDGSALTIETAGIALLRARPLPPLGDSEVDEGYASAGETFAAAQISRAGEGIGEAGVTAQLGFEMQPIEQDPAADESMRYMPATVKMISDGIETFLVSETIQPERNLNVNPSSGYIWPTDGIITSRFGYRNTTVGSTNHKGLDIGGSHGQAIVAANEGEVTFSGWEDGYGRYIRIQHENGDVTLYSHNSALLVNEGDWVSQGQEIARMGATGVVTGVHLHFEIIIDGIHVDPLKHLP